MGKKISFSQIVSRVFDPVVEIPLAIVLAVWFSVTQGLRWRFLIVLLFVDALVPFIFFLLMLAKGEVSNWDIRERKERIPIYIFAMLMHLLGVGIAWLTGKQDLLVDLLSFYAVGILFMLVTMFWKISLHTGVIALLITFCNLLVGWKYWWMYGVVFLVGWARMKDKHHSLVQVVIGALAGGGGFLLFFFLFSRIFGVY